MAEAVHPIIIFLITNFLYAATLSVPLEYETIQLAINNSANYDTVLVSPGTYQENLVVGNVEIITPINI